jgi:delta-aminolevulinic acid dehydratase/porphobilinogen synthase
MTHKNLLIFIITDPILDEYISDGQTTIADSHKAIDNAIVLCGKGDRGVVEGAIVLVFVSLTDQRSYYGENI